MLILYNAQMRHKLHAFWSFNELGLINHSAFSKTCLFYNKIPLYKKKLNENSLAFSRTLETLQSYAGQQSAHFSYFINNVLLYY